MHEKTFAAINKLKDIELELHRLKNALEMANKALDAQRPWVELTDEDINTLYWNREPFKRPTLIQLANEIITKFKEKNNAML